LAATLTAYTFILVILNQCLKVFPVLLKDNFGFIHLELWIKALLAIDLSPILVHNDIVIVILSIPKHVLFFSVKNIDFSDENVLNINTECFLANIGVFLAKFKPHVIILRYRLHFLYDIPIPLELDEVNILQLTLHHKHTLVVLEIKVIVSFESHQLVYFYTRAHSFNELLLLLQSRFLEVMVLTHLLDMVFQKLLILSVIVNILVGL
jgi:hypothetical protein